MTFDAIRYQALLPTLIVDLVAAELKAMRPTKFEALTTAQLLASEHWAKDFTLDSLERVTLSSMAAEFFNVYASGREDTLLGTANANRWAEIVALSQSESESARDITFRSSGSTGKAKHFRHRADWLVQEAAHWAERIQHIKRIERNEQSGARRIVSFVPSHHIYGYIWTILLPVIANLPVVFARGMEIVKPDVNSDDVLIATPRLYEQWAAQGVGLNGALAISSTGRLESMSADEVCVSTGLADLWEIYGSSETAGLGSRGRNQVAYTWLPYIASIANEQDIRIVDRATPDGSVARIELPDAIYSGENAREFHVGKRHDDIVKVFGQRVDVNALREGLRTVDGVRDANVRVFREGNTAALKAFVVPVDNAISESALIDRCKLWIATHTDAAAMISSWQTGSAVPVNALGKRADW
jgi:long-chain acyl-CoA synthetase